MTQRGDVVIVDFPFTDVPSSKVRPAPVVQNDRDNQRLRKTIIALVTGNLRRATEPTHLLVDPTTAEGAGSGLYGPSLVSCINLYTVEQVHIIKTIGQLPDATKQKVNDCLRAALELT